MGECTRHTLVCGAGTGVLLIVKTSQVRAVVAAAAFVSVFCTCVAVAPTDPAVSWGILMLLPISIR